MGSPLGRFKHRLLFSKRLRGGLRVIKLTLPIARDVAVIALAVLAIYIAYRDYLKTDVQLAITAPSAGGVVLNREISIEGTISGGPYNGYEVHHKALGDEQGRLVSAVQESGEQMAAPVFPISLSLVDEDGSLRIGQHTITVTLMAGNRNVEQDSVSFNVIDCLLIMPRELVADKPICGVIDLRPDQEVPGYDFLYSIDGIQWTLDSLDSVHLEDRYYQLCVAAVVRGSEEEVDSVTTNFVVDNTAPIIESPGLSEGANVSGQSKLVPQICDPHLEELELCVDNELVGSLEGQALDLRLESGDLGFTLENAWEIVDAALQSQVADEDAQERRLKDGWHDVSLKACDVNGLCSTESVRVWVDSTRPELRWDLARDTAIPVRPTDRYWLGASSPDPEAEITYYVESPATIVEGEFLDTSECEPGGVHTVLGTATDLACNPETQIAHFVVERSSQAWLNTAWRQVSHGIAAAVAPVLDVFDRFASEGLSIGVGAEVSSSLADESALMWRGVLGFVSAEVCPMFGRGINENITIGIGFRVLLESVGLAASVPGTPLLCPVLDFGTAVTPNWEILDSLDFGTEKVAETWVKLSLSTVVSIPLSARTDAALKLDVGPGCKLSFVQELKREAEYFDGQVVGIRRFVESSLKLEVTIDGSIIFSAGGQSHR